MIAYVQVGYDLLLSLQGNIEDKNKEDTFHHMEKGSSGLSFMQALCFFFPWGWDKKNK